MSISIRSLADFKRFLATPGATLQVIRNEWGDPNKTSHPLPFKPGYFEPKQVQKLQSNTVQFTSGSWLRFPKTSEIKFEDDTVIIDLNQNGKFEHVLVYKLTLAQ